MSPETLQFAITGPVIALGMLGVLAFGLWLDKRHSRKNTDG